MKLRNEAIIANVPIIIIAIFRVNIALISLSISLITGNVNN